MSDSSIKQIYISDSLSNVVPAFLNRFDLRLYDNPNEDVIMIGVYSKKDYKFMNDHPGCVVCWCGSDSQMMYPVPEGHRHIAVSTCVQDTLTENGLESKVISMTGILPIANPVPRGDSIYFYTSEVQPQKYGTEYVDEIRQKTGLNIITAYPDTYPYEQMPEIYGECFIGLRMCVHDGNGTTALELGLMGRRTIYNGDCPSAIHYENVDDVVKKILYEYHHRHEDNTQIAIDTAEHLKQDFSYARIRER